MTRRTPDRWKRMTTQLRLEHTASPWVKQIPLDAWPTLELYIVEILHKQHRAVVRMVKKLSKDGAGCWHGHIAPEAILAKLREQAR